MKEKIQIRLKKRTFVVDIKMKPGYGFNQTEKEWKAYSERNERDISARSARNYNGNNGVGYCGTNYF